MESSTDAEGKEKMNALTVSNLKKKYPCFHLKEVSFSVGEGKAAAVTASYTVPFIRNYIDKPGFAYLSYQIVVLLVGIIAYTLVTALATHLSVRRFEKVDI